MRKVLINPAEIVMNEGEDRCYFVVSPQSGSLPPRLVWRLQPGCQANGRPESDRVEIAPNCTLLQAIAPYRT